MIRRSLLIMSALAIVAGVTACGGTSGESAKPQKSSGAHSPGVTDAGQIGDAATAADRGSGGSSGSKAGSGGRSVGTPDNGGKVLASDFKFTGKDSDAFCSDMKELQNSFKSSSDAPPSFSSVAAEVAKMDPPPELEDAWPAFVAVQKSLADQGDGSGANLDAATMAKFATASDKVNAYLTNVCGI